MRVTRSIVVACLIAGPALAQAPATQWGPAPPFLPAGARFALMQGDPSQPGVYTIRLELPDGYVIPPHFHPTDEYVTVIEGTLNVGMGDSVKTQSMTPMRAGAFINAAANAHHYVSARGHTVVQVHGMGPFAITYVRQADDPRARSTP